MTPDDDAAGRPGARWLLEEVLAGRVPRPQRGEVNSIRAEVEAARLRANTKES